MGHGKGFISENVREYLVGDEEFNSENHRSTTHSRLWDQIYTGLEIDSHILAELEAEDRQKIFSKWQNRNYDEPLSNLDLELNRYNSTTNSLARSQLTLGIRGLLKFLYLGVEENVGDFESILEDAIDEAARERGKYVADFDLHIEFGPLPTLEELHEAFKAGDKRLNGGHIEALYQEGYIDDSDLNEYLDSDSSDSSIFGSALDPRTGNSNRDLDQYYREESSE